MIGTIVANRGPQAGGAQADNLTNLFRDPAPAGTVRAPSCPVSGAWPVVRAAPEDMPLPTVYQGEFPPNALAACADLARTPGFGRCPAGAEVAWVSPDLDRRPRLAGGAR